MIGGSSGGSMLMGSTTGNDLMYAGTQPTTTNLGGFGPRYEFGSQSGGQAAMVSTTGNDAMFAFSGPTTMWGGSGHDTMWLGSGNDTVYGGAGAETVNSGAGNATIVGGNSTVINETNMQASIVSKSVVGGVTQITFGNGQQLDARSATINFAGGGTIHT